MKKAFKWYAAGVGVLLVLFWIGWILLSSGGLPLSPWHKLVPREMTVAEIDAASWEAYAAYEDDLIADTLARVADSLPEGAKIAYNRYYEGAPIHPGRFGEDWNRSFVLRPAGEPVGAAVLLHGLTDSPYSLRHIAELYRGRGFVAVCIRMPGHGTVPGALARAKWESWMAATRLAVREARRLKPGASPLHVVGYSNGAALAMKYTLDALEEGEDGVPDRLVMLSPMIGITRYARFAGIAALPALLPPFAKTAWQSVVPEYNPFKYNSFAINGARQTYRLTRALQAQIRSAYERDGLVGVPPVLSFQSALDSTVSTEAIFYDLYEHLPQNGSELVLFDVNRAADLTPLMNPASRVVLSHMLPPLPVPYTLTVIANAETASGYDVATSANTYVPGLGVEWRRPLDLPYPPEIFSLSHVAIPFPMDDALYGIAPPEGAPAFGISLGTLSARGERGTLAVDMDSLFRTSSNPFFPYMMERIGAGIDDPSPDPAARPHERREASPDLYDREYRRLTGDDADDEILP